MMSAIAKLMIFVSGILAIVAFAMFIGSLYVSLFATQVICIFSSTVIMLLAIMLFSLGVMIVVDSDEKYVPMTDNESVSSGETVDV